MYRQNSASTKLIQGQRGTKLKRLLQKTNTLPKHLAFTLIYYIHKSISAKLTILQI